MQTTTHGWTIIDAEAGVLSLTYTFAGAASANCFTMRLRSGGLAIISPPPGVGREVIDDLSDHGEIEAIVANNGFHHLGIALWRETFPKARCFAAAGAATRIGKKSKTAGELEPLSALEPLLADGVAILEAPASKCGETWARAKISGGYAWYASDILVNMPRLPSSFFIGLLFRLTKSAPGYRVFHLALMLILKDKKAALRVLLDDVREHPPSVMVPAHGEILSAETIADDTERVLSAALG